MEQLVILLIIGAISLINWLLQKSAEHKKRRGGGTPSAAPTESFTPPWEEPAPAHRRSDGSSQEEQMRRFFEALGLPPPEEHAAEPVVTPSFEIEPPPIPEPRAQPAPRLVETPRPTGRVFPPPEPEQPSVLAPRPTLRENREMRELAEQFAASERDAASTTGTQAAFRSLLSDAHGARQAIILQEILNPPRALRPYSA